MKTSNHLIAGLLALAFLAPGSAFARSDGRCGNCGTVVAVQPVLPSLEDVFLEVAGR